MKEGIIFVQYIQQRSLEKLMLHSHIEEWVAVGISSFYRGLLQVICESVDSIIAIEYTIAAKFMSSPADFISYSQS